MYYSSFGENPTKLYYDAVQELLKNGEECSPRGKLIKELRPVMIGFQNPYNRVTFLGSRRVNPFFQLAESLWIVSGRADVRWLTKFNANMSTFSDDGVWFNAPYGERIRAWNKNALHGVIINPIDQMMDAYNKLLADKDTRQAVVVISNPMFDNYRYTVGEKGKDIACNLIFTFKIRNDKLDITVFNRSNDAHWGLWGANLCQFSTIQEVMLNWLRNSGVDEFANLELGTYTQMTDSLHIYLDDYGAKCTTDVQKYYEDNPVDEVNWDFTCADEPKMSLNKDGFNRFLQVYWEGIDGYIQDDNYLLSEGNQKDLLDMVYEARGVGVIDEYWTMAIHAMIAYRLMKMDRMVNALEVMSLIPACQWKVSMMYFLKSFIKKLMDTEAYGNIVYMYEENVDDIQKHLVHQEYAEGLKKYLSL